MFMQSFARLPEQMQRRTVNFLEKFEADPAAQGFNYETINAAADKKIKSVRINDAYRAIVKQEERTGTYVLLWVDHHDEAYNWAANRRCEINSVTGKLQVFCVEEGTMEPVPEQPEESTGLFSALSEDDLLKMGVPQRYISLVRSIKDYRKFDNIKYLLPADSVENLEWIANDIPAEEVLGMIADAEKPAGENGELVSDNSFVIIDDQEELRNVINGSLEKWRVFLHPSQRSIVDKNYAGPARVLGEAGTGKTVVAMHRAKRLASMLGPNQKVLFTTFTTNLADDIKANLKKICTEKEYSNIEVTSMDAWVSRFLAGKGWPAKLVYGKDLKPYWERAVSKYPGTGLGREFFSEEWAAVAAPNEAFSFYSYIQTSRVGRGTRLDRQKKAEVWKVFEEFINMTKADKVMDIDTAIFACKELIKKEPVSNRYPNIIIDEGQDFSANAYSLIRAIAGEEHENDIFIVGDSHQRIYRRKAALSRCGINIKGRSSKLRVNYRTTEEIRKYAFSILSGLSFDDLDGNDDQGRESRSFTHGPGPESRNFNTQNEESDFICKEINRLISGGALAKDICLVARTKKLLDVYMKSLSGSNIRYYEVKPGKYDDRSLDGVRIATMHRVKGLEFQYVFIAAASKGIIPLESAIDHTDIVSENETEKAERCLVYVALTRAQKYACITSFGKPSPFLPET